MKALTQQLEAYLDTLTITPDNIGKIRRSLLMPFDTEWNAAVRDLTAAREGSPDLAAKATPDVPKRADATMTMSLQCHLASIAVHAQELSEPGAHEFDAEALRTSLHDAEVQAWLEAMTRWGMAPVKRSAKPRA